MSRELAAAVGAVCGVLLALAGMWLAGFDFDERGARAVVAFVLSIVCGIWAWVLVWTYPGWGWDDIDRGD